MDNRLKQDALIEDVLKSQPLASMPRSITMDVIKRIQKDTRPAVLTWNDILLGFVIAACFTALWFASQNLPPLMLAKLRIQGILLYQDFLVNARWLEPSLFFVIGAIVSVLTIPTLYKMTKDTRR